ncbi:MAG: MBL fold metallo-hydrolase [Bosea sp. (in: a-proteobacteria)]
MAMAGGLSFIFLGTGAPPVSLRRAGPSHLVRGGGQTILVDCGARVAHQLVEAGVRAAEIDALIVTHLHSDHIVDFYQLVITSWHQGRDRPWRVIAPQPVIKALRAHYAAYDDERTLRIAFEKRPSATGLDVSFEELREGTLAGFGDLRVSAFEVDHAPVHPAFGLTFNLGGNSIVFSGDTRPCAALEKAAARADVFVCEVYVEREMPVTAGVRSAETVQAVKSYHMTPDEIAAVATRASVKAVALTHIVPPGADTGLLLSDVRAGGYTGPLIVSEDLMTLTLPDRTVRWKGMALSF